MHRKENDQMVRKLSLIYSGQRGAGTVTHDLDHAFDPELRSLQKRTEG
jgi:hypothetical protein